MKASPIRAAAAAFDDATLSAYDAEIGRRLRDCRKAAGLTQTQLGDAVGVSFQQIQKYERGTNRVSSSMLIAFAAVLNVAPSAFIDSVVADVDAGGDVPPDRVRALAHSPAGARIAAAFPTIPACDRTRLAELAELLAGFGRHVVGAAHG